DCEDGSHCVAGACTQGERPRESAEPGAWEAPGGPRGFSWAGSLAVSGERVEVAGPQLHLSTDGGLTWTSSAPPPNVVEHVAVAGDTLLVGNSDAEGAISLDWGRSWQRFPFLVLGIHVDETGIWLSGAEEFFALEGEIRHSTDGGRTWESRVAPATRIAFG